MKASRTCREPKAQGRPNSLKPLGGLLMWQQGWAHMPDVCRASYPGQASGTPAGTGRPTELHPGPSGGGLVREAGGKKGEAGSQAAS